MLNNFNPYEELISQRERIQRLEVNQAFIAKEMATLIDKLVEHSRYLNQLAVEIQTDRLTNLTRVYAAPSDESKQMKPWYYRFWGK